MFIQPISRRILLSAIACVAFAVVVARADSDEATSTSWHANTRKTVEDGVIVTSEGTAVFATGEKAHVVLKGVAGPQAAWYRGTATVDSVYQFDDGSSFTLQYVQIWDGLRSLAAGLFCEGTGRFAGIKGGGTASGGAPSGPMSWTGMYELPKR